MEVIDRGSYLQKLIDRRENMIISLCAADR